MVKKSSLEVNSKNSSLWLLVQCVLFFMLIVFGIISLISKEFFIVFQAIMIMLLLVISYNNHKIFKRKKFSIICLIFSILILISLIMGLFNGR